ncbi:centromere/kinetochore protein zw10 homolog [Apostichopus japonicus]|uniref:centromere/kinetochore protein zw10 homolog n=1 Tax=Stichopus japonicus TaxID=307972 RepID=UPI003AB4B12B
MESQSLVTNVLAKTGFLEKEDLSQRMKKLFAQVDDLKGEINQAVNDRYVNFKPSLDTMGELKGRVTGIERDVLELKKTLKLETKVKLRDLTEVKDMMDEVCATIVILQLLNQIHNDFGRFKDHLVNKEYVESAAILSNVTNNYQKLSNSPFSEHQIVVALHMETISLKTRLCDCLDQMWYNCIVFHKTEPAATLTIVKDPQLLNMLEAMQVMDVLGWRLKSFAKLFKETLIDAIILDPSSDVTVSQAKQEVSLRVTSTDSKNLVKPPQEMFAQLQKALECIQKLFSRCRFDEDGESQSLMKMLGNLLWGELSKSLINHCLMPSIPTLAADLEDYKTTISATQQFEESLRKLDFIGHEKPLLEYAENVNIHFATKKCQEILVMARDLMKQDLYTSVEVGKRKTEKKKISEFFPACKISKSTQDLLELAEETLRQASSKGAAPLFCTVRNLFGMYVDIVPTYHKETLRDLPQVTALFHNNCMYLAHHLKTLGHRCRHTLPTPFRDSIITFVDLVPTFTRMAADVFLSQMRNQRDQLKESLAMARGFQDVSSDDVYPDAEKSVKQVLHQLNLLHTVWSDVLPSSTFIKAMATLIGAVLQDVIEKVASLEDISADDARQLHDLLSKVKDKVPNLLKPKHSQVKITAVHIKEWTRFEELMFILEASMKDIVERWADGKGPLADVFEPLQVKGMIRALFQNTERRADALSHIRIT